MKSTTKHEASPMTTVLGVVTLDHTDITAAGMRTSPAQSLWVHRHSSRPPVDLDTGYHLQHLSSHAPSRIIAYIAIRIFNTVQKFGFASRVLE